MSKLASSSFSDYLKNSEGPDLNFLLYLKDKTDDAELHEDFCLKFLELFSPTFRIVEGHVYLAATFDQAEYDAKFQRLRSFSEVQYWLNLYEITYIFENMSVQNAMQFANRLATLWNLRIEAEYPDALGRASVLYDEEQQEVFVCIKTEEM